MFPAIDTAPRELHPTLVPDAPQATAPAAEAHPTKPPTHDAPPTKARTADAPTAGDGFAGAALALVVPRTAIPEVDLRRYEHQLADILAALGMDMGAPGTIETPRRLLAAWIEATSGYEGDPKLVTTFPSEWGAGDAELAQVVEGPISFSSLCEHHVLPFHGSVWLGYIAGDRILGLSKLTRLVRVVSRRFSMQERITRQLADALETITGARGVAVRIEAEHSCMQLRGVREPAAKTLTSAYRGRYLDDATLRAEFAALVGPGGRS